MVPSNRDALEAVIRHAALLEEDDDYGDVAPALKALTTCADISLVPRLGEALDQFLKDRNCYGRDLIAGVLAGIQGVAALPELLLALPRRILSCALGPPGRWRRWPTRILVCGRRSCGWHAIGRPRCGLPPSAEPSAPPPAAGAGTARGRAR